MVARVTPGYNSEHADIQPTQWIQGTYRLHQVDAFEWLRAAPHNSIHAVVTDPPYGVLEYSDAQITKRNAGRGGVWRIPPSFDGHNRLPVPRFTVLTAHDKSLLRAYFRQLAEALMPVLMPGACLHCHKPVGFASGVRLLHRGGI